MYWTKPQLAGLRKNHQNHETKLLEIEQMLKERNVFVSMGSYDVNRVILLVFLPPVMGLKRRESDLLNNTRTDPGRNSSAMNNNNHLWQALISLYR